MLTYLKDFSIKFLAGDLDPIVTHWVLLCTSIAAEFAVAIGIILETPKEKTCRERVGMILVIGGVCVGAIFTVLLFLFDEGLEKKVYDVAQSASGTAAKQGVQIVQQQGVIDQYSVRLDALEQRLSTIENRKPAAPVPAPIPAPSVSVIAPRNVGPNEVRIIRAVTMPGATISIIPFMPDLERFADALASAFEAVPGAQIAVGRGNTIVNGQEGLIVQYDHSDIISASVFRALEKAGLRPTEGPPISGSVVYIRVASP